MLFSNGFGGGGGRGQGGGKGGGSGNLQGQGQGLGRMGGRGLGPGGKCVCPNCGETVSHRRGVPCYDIKCSKCGEQMTRK